MTTTPTTPTSGAADLPEALHRVLDDFERRKHSIPQAHIAAALATELRAALAAGQATAAQQSGAKLNYSVLYVYASQHGIDYNSLCVAVREASAQPAAQQGVAYAALPDIDEDNGLIWQAIFDWKDCERGAPALAAADRLSRLLADQMHAFADATHTLRASHGQAPAGAAHEADSAPAVGYPPLPNLDGSDEQIWEAIFNWKTATPGADAVRKANKVENAIIGTMRACVDADRAARAPEDSVLEDAARYRLLRRGRHWSVIDGIGNDLRAEALDAAVDAARKQGATQ